MTLLTLCSRRKVALLLLSLLFRTGQMFGQQDKTDPLPSWNDGAAKKAILEFVRVTTDKSSPKFVPPEQRIATFDQDGTLWVEHPMYTQVIYCLERVPAVVKEKPELKDKEQPRRRFRSRGWTYLERAIAEYRACLDAAAPTPDAELWRLAAETDFRRATALLQARGK